MNRGVSFRIPQVVGDVLWQILKCINVENYCWYNLISQNEAWSYENNSKGNAFFLESDYYDGKSFWQNIHTKYYIIFLKLQAYFENGVFFDIHTYADFLRSDCQLLLLIYDCEYVEIYAKSEKTIKAIFENAIANNYVEIKYITESNDGRTGMDVL